MLTIVFSLQSLGIESYLRRCERASGLLCEFHIPQLQQVPRLPRHILRQVCVSGSPPLAGPHIPASKLSQIKAPVLLPAQEVWHRVGKQRCVATALLRVEGHESENVLVVVVLHATDIAVRDGELVREPVIGHLFFLAKRAVSCVITHTRLHPLLLLLVDSFHNCSRLY
jgi:hypothetical protein